MGHKTLLKSVLTKSVTNKMSNTRSVSKNFAMMVYGLVNEYCQKYPEHDKFQMKLYKEALEEYLGAEAKHITVTLEGINIRFHLENSIMLLMEPLESEGPTTFTKLNAIDWRKLFGIDPQPPIQIVVIPGSDDDSGGGGSATSSS